MGEITTLLGRGATFEGKLTFEGTVRIDGRFKGEVFSDDVLVIGEGAIVGACSVVTGSVEANTVNAGNPCRFIKHIQGSQEIRSGASESAP